MFLHMLSHYGGCKSDVIAFFALREFRVGRRWNSVYGEEVEKHVIAFYRAMPTEFACLRIGLESVCLDKVIAVLVISFQSESSILPILRSLYAIVADPGTRDVVERRYALIHCNGSARAKTGASSFSYSDSGIVLTENRGLGAW